MKSLLGKLLWGRDHLPVMLTGARSLGAGCKEGFSSSRRLNAGEPEKRRLHLMMGECECRLWGLETVSRAHILLAFPSLASWAGPHPGLLGPSREGSPKNQA